VKAPVWVLEEAVLALHEQLLAVFGGSSGIRDRGHLESALARPVNLLAYGAPSVFDLAASYGFGLVKNHPFMNGNKRTGFTVAVSSLELNGYRFEATEADATVRTLALAADEMSEAEYSAWLAANARRVRGRT
jgi:death-on-curing protein